MPTGLLLDSREVCFSAQPALKAAIGQYIIVTNTKPKLFMWTKIADDILTSVAQLFCPRPSETDTKLVCILKMRARRRPMRLSMTPHSIIAGKET